MDEADRTRLEKIRTYSLMLIAIFIAVIVLKQGKSVIVPVFIASFIFIFINPFLNKCDNARIHRSISMIFSMAVVLVIFVLFIYTFFAMVDTLMRKLPQYVGRVNALDAYFSTAIRNVLDIPEEQSFSLLSRLNIDWFGIISSALASVSSKFVDILGDCLLIYLYLFFIILERNTITPKIVMALPQEKGDKLIKMIGSMNKLTGRYLVLKLAVSGGTGLLFYVTAILSGLDFPLVWGILAFLLNFIPTIGSIVVTALGIFMAVVQFFPNWNRIVAIGVAFIAIQMILGNIIDPRLQGIQLNISPLVILVSLAIWGYIWGIVGMFLAVPLTSIIQIICASNTSLQPIAILLGVGPQESKKKSFFKRKKKDDESNHNESN